MSDIFNPISRKLNNEVTTEKKDIAASDTFWQQQQQIGENLNKEHQENINKYGVDLPQEAYEALAPFIANSDNPEEEAYRIGTAYKYSEMLGIPLTEAYQNIENYNLAFWGENKADPKSNFKAVSDALALGFNNLKIGELGNAIKDAELRGDTELLEVLNKQLAVYEADNEQRQDSTPRAWTIEALKCAAQSAPFTGAVVGAGLFGNFLIPGSGGLAAFGTSASLMAGEEYVSLRKDGASPELAAKVSAVSAGLQAVAETALGDVAGLMGGKVLGKVVGKNLGEGAVGKLATKLQKRFHFGDGKKLALQIAGELATEYGKEVLGEGAEEAAQEIVSIIAREVASELGDYEIEGNTIEGYSKQVAESFKGGILGSLIISGLPLVKNATATVIDYYKVQKLAKTVPSQKAFVDAVKDSKVFDGFEENEKTEIAKNIHEAYQSTRDAQLNEVASGYTEVNPDAEGFEQAEIDEETGDVITEDEYRTETGKLYSETEIKGSENEETRAVFKFGNAEKDTKNLYGSIQYSLNEDTKTITIDKFIVAKGRENLRAEAFNDFAAANAGYNIEWNPAFKLGKTIKDNLIKNNPRGKNNGLNYFADEIDVIDADTRKKVAQEIKANIKGLTETELSGAVSILEAIAVKKGKNLSEYVNATFGPSIFGNNEELKEAALKQGVKAQGGVDWKKFGNEVKAVIYASEYSNFSTWVHELAHVYQAQLEGDLKEEAEKAFGVIDGDWRKTKFTFADGHTENAAEAFARGFEDFLATGKSSNKEMENVFKKFAEFVAQCYRNFKNFITMSPEIEDVYNKMLALDNSIIAKADKAVSDFITEEKARRKAEAKKTAKKEDKSSTLTEEEKEVTLNEEEKSKASKTTEEVIKEKNITSAEKEINVAYGATNSLSESDVEDIISTEEDKTVTDTNLEISELAQKDYLDTIDIFQLANEESILKMVENAEKDRRLEELKVAKQFDQKLKNYSETEKTSLIKRLTGWEKNASGIWQYEIDDSLYLIKSKELKKALTNNNEVTTLEDILDAQELYDIYPWLKNVVVGFINDKEDFAKGILTKNGLIFNMAQIKSIDGEKGLKGALVHEIQHLIQAKEHAKNSGLMGDDFKSLYDELYNVAQALEVKNDYDITQFTESMSSYITNEGEIEARRVARRVVMNENARRNNPFFAEYDISEKYAKTGKLNTAEKKYIATTLFQVIGTQGATNLDTAEETHSETMDIDEEQQIIMFQTLANAEQKAIDDVKKQYVNTDKWLKAPNGNDTNLTEKQWLQVRTPSFKKWFGDWESIAIKNRIEASQEVELTSVDNLPQGIEKQSIGTIIKYVSTLIAQKEVKHSELGEIEINNTGINDSLRHGRNKYKINSLLKIDEIIKKGTLIHTQIDNGKVDSFVLATRLKGRNPSYAITVIKQKRDGRKYYDHNIILKNKLETAEQIQNGNTSEMLHPALKSLLQKIYSVNENSVSKVIDENGEPLVVYHGTSESFDVFSKTQKNDAGWLGKGFYFYGSSERDALQYGKNLYSVFLNVREPYFISYEEVENLSDNNDNDLSSKFSEEIKDDGYDGVYFNGNLNKEYAVFLPNQIKSATDNSGEFNAENPSILFQEEQKEIFNILTNIIETEEMLDYKKRYYDDLKENYETKTLTTQDGEITATLEVYKFRTENLNELDAAIFLASQGHKVVVLKETGKKQGEKRPDLLLNDKVFVELKCVITENSRNIGDEIVKAIKKGKQNIPTIIFLKKSQQVDYQEIIDSLNMRTETNTEKRKVETELLKNNKYVLFIKNNKISLIKNNGEGVYKTFEQSLKPRPDMNIQSTNDIVNQNSTILYQRAYHGTPHNFDKFSTSAIGTGEGNQSFGWGLYFTNQEDIARWYANSTVRKNENISFAEVMLEHIDNGTSFEAEKAKVLERYKIYETLHGFKRKHYEDRYLLAANLNSVEDLRKIVSLQNKRNLYTAELPDNGYLLWDKEYDAKDLTSLKQPLFNRLLDEYFGGDKENTQYEVDAIFYDGITGEEFYHSLQHELGSDKAASLFLKENGYIGIDYPANSIAGHTNEGERNYVIFDEKDVEIINHMLFQTQEELIQDALSFDTWQEFYEFYEVNGKPEITPIPDNADAQWFQTTWELAHGLKPEESIIKETIEEEINNSDGTPEALDALWLTSMARPGMLEEFLNSVYKIMTFDFDNEFMTPSDAEEEAEFNKLAELKHYLQTQLRHGVWFSNAQRVYGGKELTEATRNRMLSLMRNAARDYRAIWAEVTGDEQFKVDENDKISTKLKNKLVSVEDDFIEKSPEERRKIAEELANKEIAQKIKDGTLLMDDELERYIKSLDKEIKTLEKRYNTLDSEVKEDYQNMSDVLAREILRVNDDLLKARANYKSQSDEISRKIEKGLDLTGKYKLKAQNLWANYNAIFRKLADLKKAYGYKAEIEQTLKRKEEVYAIKEDLNAKKKEKNLLEAQKKLRIGLVKRSMRRVPFDRIDYENARALIAIQRIFEPNLLGGVNRWIGQEGPYLRGVWSQWHTDADFREQLTKKLLSRVTKKGKTVKHKTKGKEAVIELLNRTKTEEDFNNWTLKERRLAGRLLPKEDWIKELGLEKLAKEREESIQLEIGETVDIKVDAEGKAYTLTKPVFSDEVGKLVKDALGDKLFNQLVKRPFAEWTVSEMEAFAKRIDDIYIEGRDLLQAKRQAKIDKAREIREEIEKVINTTGIVINDDDSDEVREAKQEKINAILGNKTALKGTIDNKDSGFFAKVKRLISGYSDANVLRVARILDNYSDGINVSELYDKEDECYNEQERMKLLRSDKIKKAMADNQIDIDDLMKTVEIDGRSFTIDELLFFIQAAKDVAFLDEAKEKEDYFAPTAKNAVMFGVFGSQETDLTLKEDCLRLNEIEELKKLNGDYTQEELQFIAANMYDFTPGTTTWINHCKGLFDEVLAYAVKNLDQKYLDFARAIEEDYAEQYDRMNKASIDVFNQPVARVNNYVPLVRLESNGDTNSNKVKEDLLATSSIGKSWVDKGMTKKRVHIGPLYQRPVETGLYKTWLNSIDRTEHFIAYSDYVRELNRVYKGRDAQYLRGIIEARYGKSAVSYIDSYINEVANPDASSVRTTGDELLRMLRGKTAPAYLAWKVSSIVKQGLTSPMPFLQFVNPLKYIAASFDIIKTKGRLYDLIKAKSVFMANRVMDPMNELINELAEEKTDKVNATLNKVGKIGMKGLEWIDWACVAPGWLACYRSEYDRLQKENELKFIVAKIEKENNQKDINDPDYMSSEDINAAAINAQISETQIESMAIKYADDCVRQAQPSSRKADLAPLFKQNSEAWKALLQFQTSLNVIWQNIKYDIPYAVKNKAYGRIVGIISGYVIAGILMNFVTEGIGGGDDDEREAGALRDLLYYSTTQFTDAVPIIGSAISQANKKIITGKSDFIGQGSDLTPMISKFIQASQQAVKGDWTKAAGKTAEGFALATGLPVSGAKEALKVFGVGDKDGSFSLHLEALLSRDIKEK